ncbi:MAG: hypothetical protein ACK4L4_20345, partial [Gemmobacter sp.]
MAPNRNVLRRVVPRGNYTLVLLQLRHSANVAHAVPCVPFALALSLRPLEAEAEARQGRAEEVLAVLDSMPRYGVRPTLPVFNTALHACARAADTASAERVLQQLQAAGARPDEITTSGVLSAWAAAGKFEGVAWLYAAAVGWPPVMLGSSVREGSVSAD